MDKTLQCTSVAMCDASCTLFFGFVYWHSHPCDKVRYLPTHGWCFSLKTTDSRNNLNWLWRSESIMKWCDLIINNSHEIRNPPGSKQQMPQCSTPSSSSPIPPPWDYCGSYSADEIKMQGMFGIMCLKTSWYEASTYYHLLYEAKSHSSTSGPENWNNCVNYNIFSCQLFYQ